MPFVFAPQNVFFWEPPILRLPVEVVRKILAELVKDTQSASSLLAPYATCRMFFKILEDSPELWTQVRVTAHSLNRLVTIYPNNPMARYRMWPGLHTILKRSENLPVSISLQFVAACDSATENLRLYNWVLPDHIVALMQIIREGKLGRIQKFGARCSLWLYMKIIIDSLYQTRLAYTSLQLVDLQCVHADISYLPFDATEGEDTLLFSPIEPGITLEINRQLLFPALNTVLLHRVPIHLPLFIPDKLVVLSLKNIPSLYPDASLIGVLLANQYSLLSLELYPDYFGDGFNGKELTLPHVYNLSVGVLGPGSALTLVEKLRLPSLKRLSVEDRWNNESALYDTHQLYGDLDDLRSEFLEVYKSMMKHWPLEQVTYMKLSHVVFYETAQNLVSLLPLGMTEPVNWGEHGGSPVTSAFLGRFAGLETLTLEKPDRTVWLALGLIYDAEMGLFQPVSSPWLPKLEQLYVDGVVFPVLKRFWDEDIDFYRSFDDD
ncbi:hypothetical protein L218DRAFT_87268 [Marasmius fiardii PR-910]|nr:hypothetical protein L218DRAFT_87268 [Marasmius fiardii PR-910]